MVDDPRFEDWLYEITRWLVAFGVAGAIIVAFWLGMEVQP